MKEIQIEPYVNNEEDDDDVLLDKICAAKFAYRVVNEKMSKDHKDYNEGWKFSDNEDSDYHSQPSYYGY